MKSPGTGELGPGWKKMLWQGKNCVACSCHLHRESGPSPRLSHSEKQDCHEAEQVTREDYRADWRPH